ncbi:MAG: hypothetical protein ACO36I_23925, partial [Candidatus Latescibacterota bacterium]
MGDVLGDVLEIWVVIPQKDIPDSTVTGQFDGEDIEFYPSLPEEELRDASLDSVINQAPIFMNRANANVLVGLKYVFDPVISDSDGDSIWILDLEKPSWLQFSMGRYEGYAPVGGPKDEHLSLAVTDGRDTTFQTVKFKVLDLTAIGLSFVEQTLLEASQYQIDWPFAEQYEMQLDGDWEWHRNEDKITLKPLKEGLQLLALGVSYQGESVYKSWMVDVLPQPQVILVGVVLIPSEDHNQDGHIDLLEDQVVFFQNTGNTRIDLSNWYVGEAYKANTQIPPNTVLLPGEILNIYGKTSQMGNGQGLSANGVIGDGLKAGDIIVLMTESLKDTLIFERIPDLPNGKILQKSDGTWSLSA